MISGTEGLDTAIARITNGRVLTKGGAEGVQMATIPSEGLGIALKIEDGAKRAASHAILTLLQQLDVLSSAEEAELLQRFGPILRNGVGQEIGEIRASEALSGNAVRIAPKPSITHRQFQL